MTITFNTAPSIRDDPAIICSLTIKQALHDIILQWNYNETSSSGTAHKGRPQRRVWINSEPADRGGAKDFVDVRKMALFETLFQHALQTLP